MCTIYICILFVYSNFYGIVIRIQVYNPDNDICSITKKIVSVKYLLEKKKTNRRKHECATDFQERI